MKVLLVNGSPHAEGSTYTALKEVEKPLLAAGVSTQWFYIGNEPLRGCAGCWACKSVGSCVFDDDKANQLMRAIIDADGLVVGSPVYYAGPNGGLCALMDRAFCAGAKHFAGKPAAALAVCRRGGATAALDRLNKYFAISRMPIATSQYWNIVHGMCAKDVQEDLEGLQTMRTLAANMLWLLNATKALPAPQREEPLMRTNFIR